MNLLSSYIDKEDFVTDDVIDIGDNTQIVNIIENILKQNKIKYSLEKHQFNLEDFKSNHDYDEPIDWSNVKSCKFEHDTENDTIFVII